MKNEPGYVYILTNPSFREDWVKIGKSSREVNIRFKFSMVGIGIGETVTFDPTRIEVYISLGLNLLFC